MIALTSQGSGSMRLRLQMKRYSAGQGCIKTLVATNHSSGTAMHELDYVDDLNASVCTGQK